MKREQQEPQNDGKRQKTRSSEESEAEECHICGSPQVHTKPCGECGRKMCVLDFTNIGCADDGFDVCLHCEDDIKSETAKRRSIFCQNRSCECWNKDSEFESLKRISRTILHEMFLAETKRNHGQERTKEEIFEHCDRIIRDYFQIEEYRDFLEHANDYETLSNQDAVLSRISAIKAEKEKDQDLDSNTYIAASRILEHPSLLKLIKAEFGQANKPN